MKRIINSLLLLSLFISISGHSLALTQYGFLFRNDDGNENAATQAGHENQNLENIQAGQNFRLRIAVKTDESDNHALQKSGNQLELDNNYITSIIPDESNEYAYLTTDESPAKIIKIKLSNLAIVETLVLNDENTETSNIDTIQTGVISPDGQYAYYASYDDPMHIVKIDLEDFEYVEHIELIDGIGYATSSVISPHGYYLYIGTKNGEVIRIDLRNFSEVNTDVISLASDETELYSAIINKDGSRVYFGTHTDPGKIITINTELDNFSKQNSYILSEGNINLRTAVLDESSDFAYFGTNTEDGRIIKVDLLLADKEQATLKLSNEVGSFYSSQINELKNEIYFTSYSNPARVVTLDLSDFSKENLDVMNLNNDQKIYTSALTKNGLLLASTDSSPGNLFQLQESTSNYQFRLEYGITEDSCNNVSEWNDAFDNNDIELIDSIHIGEPSSSNVEGLISDDAETFIPGQLLEFDSQSNVIQLNPDEFTELEYSLTTDIDAPAGNYCFRLTNAGNPGPFTYSVYPELSIEDFQIPDQEFPDDIDLGDYDLSTNCIHNDLPSDYEYCPQIIYNYELGTFTGDGEGKFRPNSGVLRAEAAKILNVAKKINMSNYSNDGTADFNDTKAGEWYIEYLKASRDSKVIYGYPDGSFKPAQTAIRAEFVTMLTRALNINTSNACNQEYADDIIEDSYWGPSACYLIKHKILDLSGSNSFNPTDPMSRIDIARMLYNARSLID